MERWVVGVAFALLLGVPGGGPYVGAHGTFEKGWTRAIVTFDHPPSPSDLQRIEELSIPVLREFRVIPALLVLVDPPRASLLSQIPSVRSVEKDLLLFPQLNVTRGLVRALEAEREFRVTGKGTTIAIFDTGIDSTHPDLSSRIVASFDASLEPTLPGGLPPPPTPPLTISTSAHATHVAGIAAGPGIRSGGVFVGVARGARLVDVRVFDALGEGRSSYVLSGLDWVLDRKEELGIRIVLLSLGGEGTDGSDALSSAIDRATEKGLLVVAAAGNGGPAPRTVGVPGVARSAVTVGAVDKSLRVAPFSARGPAPDGSFKPDLVAPGVGVVSTVPFLYDRSYYAALSGTSMAAPHVAGVAALMYEENSSLTPSLAKWILLVTARPLGNSTGWSPEEGWGLVDALEAVRASKDPSLLFHPPFRERSLKIPLDGVHPPSEEKGKAEPRFRTPLPDLFLVLLAALLGTWGLKGGPISFSRRTTIPEQPLRPR